MKLLIIADDFTGALDTGVQFAAAGVQVKVITKARSEEHTSELQSQR